MIAVGSDGPFVLLAHLPRGSVHVQPGKPVYVGDPVARCGNSGNSTEPHLHLQVSDSTEWTSARGLSCLAVLDGVPAGEAVAFVQEHYEARAVETPWQRSCVLRSSSV